MAEPDVPPEIGPYRIGRFLGAGGMGSVYQAFDRRLERPVAMKRIHGAARDPERARVRFGREAKVIAKLNHPAIVQVYDLVEHQGESWLVMELVEGESVAALLQRGALDLDALLLIAREIASGLAAAHQRGIVHRDLKSENVLVTAEGHAKILDFGLAKQLEGDASALTAEGAAIGTLRAMAPEQVDGRGADRRTDLHALGVLLYEALSGGNPFLGDSHGATLHSVLVRRPTSLAERVEGVPRSLSELIDRLLAKDPDQRPESALEVEAELERIAAESPRALALGSHMRPTASRPSASDGLGRVAPPAAAKLPPTEAMPRRVSPSSENMPGSRERRSWWWLALAASVIVLALVAGLWWQRGQRPERAARQVAVLAPEVVGLEPDRSALVAAAITDALLSGVASRPALRAAAPEVVARIEGSPIEVARALALDELLGARADCTAQLCNLSLRRIRADGSLAWSDGFRVPVEDAAAIATAVTSHLRQGYPDAQPRESASVGPPVAASAYRRYLELSIALSQRSEGTSRREAVEGLGQVLADSPQFLEAILLASKAHRLAFVEEGDAADGEQALALARRARQVSPEDPRAIRELFDVLVDRGQTTEASQLLETLETFEPGDPRTLLRQAVLLEKQGRGEEALQLAQLGAERLPAWDVLYNTASIEYRQGRVDEARAHLERALQRAPNDFDTLSFLAQIELLSGDVDRAVSLYSDLVERSRGVAELANLALAQMLIGRYEEACVGFEEVVAMVPNNPSILINLADCRLAAGSPTAAALYEQVLDELEVAASGVGYVEAMTRAQAAAQLGREGEAIRAINEALRLAPESPEVSYAAALVFAVLGERASALVHVRDSVERGLGPRWFAFPWFDDLRSDPTFVEIAESAAPRSG